ncbi:MAG: glycosyltransferase, partial [Verrucomicrobia bacterium]|nr:glycosyltransferase [Verrucomicrobiota bacterium]
MRTPRRVLLTTDCVGGVWTFTVELCRELNQLGVECVVASMGRMPDAREQLELTDLPGTRLFASDFALEWMDEPWKDVDCASEWLLELAHDERVDLVHL